ncbi:hypothetical protein [Paenibacillus sp. YYML68]|uniref:hypothetical protein n=1 Tax=Paenibacillus sp. YYML68 TaxID=2909250 RepID=UPI002491AEE0|nr:hypothetical protein [Paenibacillus sp. YYML68]
MRMKKILPAAFMAIALIGNSFVFAGTGNVSSASINYYDTFAKGSTYSMNGDVNLAGYNNPNSDNALYVELFQDTTGVDPRITHEYLTGNSSKSWVHNVSNAQYYIWLDPAGPNYYGVIGSGSASN